MSDVEEIPGPGLIRLERLEQLRGSRAPPRIWEPSGPGFIEDLLQEGSQRSHRVFLVGYEAAGVESNRRAGGRCRFRNRSSRDPLRRRPR